MVSPIKANPDKSITADLFKAIPELSAELDK